MATGEYKPRRLGDVTGSTTPIESVAPTTQTASLPHESDLFHPIQYSMLYGQTLDDGSGTVADRIVLLPLHPLPTNFRVDHVRLRISTAVSTGHFARLAFYTRQGANFIRHGPSMGISLSATGRIDVPLTAEMVLEAGQSYYLASYISTDSTATTFSSWVSSGTTRTMPLYRYTTSLEAYRNADLPLTLKIASATKIYENATGDYILGVTLASLNALGTL